MPTYYLRDSLGFTIMGGTRKDCWVKGCHLIEKHPKHTILSIWALDKLDTIIYKQDEIIQTRQL